MRNKSVFYLTAITFVFSCVSCGSLSKIKPDSVLTSPVTNITDSSQTVQNDLEIKKTNIQEENNMTTQKSLIEDEETIASITVDAKVTSKLPSVKRTSRMIQMIQFSNSNKESITPTIKLSLSDNADNWGNSSKNDLFYLKIELLLKKLPKNTNNSEVITILVDFSNINTNFDLTDSNVPSRLQDSSNGKLIYSLTTISSSDPKMLVVVFRGKKKYDGATRITIHPDSPYQSLFNYTAELVNDI
jgi:hypothetical protein